MFTGTLDDEIVRSACALIDEADRPLTQFADWPSVHSNDYDTKTNWKYGKGLVLRPGERASAEYVEREVLTSAEWGRLHQKYEQHCQTLKESGGERLEWFTHHLKQLRVARLKDDRVELITKAIPLYQVSQTRPGNFRERTKAIIQYAKVFWRQSSRTSYIKRNLEPAKYTAKWFTRDINQERFEVEPFEFLNEGKLLDHIAQRQIYGVKPDPGKPQWWCAADLDLHHSKGGKPEIFLRQVEAVLGHLQGKGWIVCLGMDCVDGIHLIKLLDKPKHLPEVRGMVQAVLQEVSELHPELESEAVAAGMKPICQAEIFPDAKRGFRLPLGRGYTALLDRPLSLVQYHTVHGQPLFGADVVSFMNWSGAEMPLEEKLAYIRQRVPSSSADRDQKVEKTIRAYSAVDAAVDKAIAADVADGKVLGHMKGRFREVLVDFYSGRLQTPKSLQTGILLGINALWAIQYPLEERGEYLLGLLQSIEIRNPEFSSRLSEGRWDEILEDIQSTIDANERLRANPSSDKIRRSNDILRNWAAAMNRIGFDFGDRSSWERCSLGGQGGAAPTFTPTDEDRQLIAAEIAPVLACSPEVAVQAVIKMVQVVASKDRNGDGISREYRRALLTDCGIHCQENAKLARCWKVVEQAGFIYVKQQHMFMAGHGGKGRACGYAIGQRVKEQLCGCRATYWPCLPDWAQEISEEVHGPSRPIVSLRDKPASVRGRLSEATAERSSPTPLHTHRDLLLLEGRK